MKPRLAIAAALLVALPLATSDAFIFQRLRDRISERRSSGSGLFSRQRAGMRMMRSRSSSSSSGLKGMSWNVEGSNSYSTSKLERPLQTVPGQDTAGLSRIQMEQMHNNLHNKVSPDYNVANLAPKPAPAPEPAPEPVAEPEDQCEPEKKKCPCCGQTLPEGVCVQDTIVIKADPEPALEAQPEPSRGPEPSFSAPSKSSCPGGNCPTTRSAPRRRLFRR